MALNKINEISINSKIVNAAKKNQYIGLARNAARTRFIFAKQEMLQEFDAHEITKELKQEPNQEGSLLVDHGNLVSFLGFPEGSTPAEDLRQYLNDNTQMENQPKIREGNKKIYYDFRVKVPSLNQINEDEQFQCPDNWRSSSWIDIIENGVSNAVYYVYAKYDEVAAKFREAGSRSGWGLQRPNKRKEGGSFTPKKYISEIIQNFIKNF